MPTIRSRCQTLRFAPVETAEIERFLIDERAFTHDEAKLSARLSRGSIGRAVSINVGQFRLRREKMLAVITNAIETGDRAALLRIAEEMNDAKNKDNFEENLDILQSLIHDVWTLSIDGDEARIVNTDLTDKLTLLAEDSASADLPAWLAAIDKMRLTLPSTSTGKLRRMLFLFRWRAVEVIIVFHASRISNIEPQYSANRRAIGCCLSEQPLCWVVRVL